MAGGVGRLVQAAGVFSEMAALACVPTSVPCYRCAVPNKTEI